MELEIADLDRLSKSKRVYLSQEVFRELVEDLQEKYGSQRKAASTLNIFQSFLSRASNGKRHSTTVGVLLKILRALDRGKASVKRIESPNGYRRRSIAKANAKKRPPDVQFEDVTSKSSVGIILDVLGWLGKCVYVKRLSRLRGVVQLTNVEVDRNVITLKYRVFKRTSSAFLTSTSVLPRFINLDTPTMYFLGLWCGDNAGGGRVGIVNQNLNILKKSAELLVKCFNQPQHHLIGNVMFSSKLDKADKDGYEAALREIGIEKITYTMNEGLRGFPVFTVSVHNSVLRRLLDFLKENLSQIFLDASAEDRGAFYGGLFDAEGNVNFNLHNRELNFRWSVKDEEFASWLVERFQEDGFLPHYDGANVKVGQRKKRRKKEFQCFEKLILPHIIHPKKQSKAQQMLDHVFSLSENIGFNRGTNERNSD
ncbi:hypothetical protein AKJ44_02120 [candidate division MSBL1 archaeon SCGC-AAA261F17]|uniref:DOD-type homing endonuclease domain-containing protein n=1 Tax=candidate division MSBL1 archaeon SCGC-AAA261F17 TaxID=1698274 RepID=A0A133V5S7_9EURY|nr:hypothetical protein AKJ44_02120 [candidate division MSBL1 archaeon SCGC-AAA261F17]